MSLDKNKTNYWKTTHFHVYIVLNIVKAAWPSEHGLDVPPEKGVFQFDVFYPWDFQNNCPLVTTQ